MHYPRGHVCKLAQRTCDLAGTGSPGILRFLGPCGGSGISEISKISGIPKISAIHDTDDLMIARVYEGGQ